MYTRARAKPLFANLYYRRATHDRFVYEGAQKLARYLLGTNRDRRDR